MTTPPAPAFEVDRILDGVQRALDAVINSAATLGVVLPSRKVAAAATVPYDCEQVLAFITGLRPGAPEATGTRSGAGDYPNPGSNVTIYQATVQLVIVRKSCTQMQGAPSASAPDPARYLDNLTNASGDGAVLLHAVNLLEADDWVTSRTVTGAVARTITFAAPQGGLMAVSCSATVVV